MRKHGEPKASPHGGSVVNPNLVLLQQIQHWWNEAERELNAGHIEKAIGLVLTCIDGLVIVVSRPSESAENTP